MSTKQMRRLQALEQATQSSKGMVIAQQDLDDPNLYRGAGEVTYTDAELQRLSDDGYQVIRLAWGNEQPIPGERKVKLTWGDLADRYDGAAGDNLITSPTEE